MIFLIIILSLLLIFFIYKYYNKKKITYEDRYFTINLEKLSDVPEWLKSYDEIVIIRTDITTHDRPFNYKTHEFKLRLYSYDDDEDGLF